jgi:hypothetical protein
MPSNLTLAVRPPPLFLSNTRDTLSWNPNPSTRDRRLSLDSQTPETRQASAEILTLAPAAAPSLES